MKNSALKTINWLINQLIKHPTTKTEPGQGSSFITVCLKYGNLTRRIVKEFLNDWREFS